MINVRRRKKFKKRNVEGVNVTWQENANCIDADPEIFFSDTETLRLTARSIKEAKSVCAECSVSNECLQYALQDNGLMGIWGGTTSRERLALRRTTTIPIQQVRSETWDYS